MLYAELEIRSAHFDVSTPQTAQTPREEQLESELARCKQQLDQLTERNLELERVNRRLIIFKWAGGLSFAQIK
jgi:hypothetical protein